MTPKIERISLPAWVAAEAADIEAALDGHLMIDTGDVLDQMTDLVRFLATFAEGGINEVDA